MHDVMKFFKQKDPSVPSVFEKTKEPSIISWWKLELRMCFPKKIVQFVFLFYRLVQLGRSRKTVIDDGVPIWSLRTQFGVERALENLSEFAVILHFLENKQDGNV